MAQTQKFCPYEETQTLRCDMLYRCNELYRQMSETFESGEKSYIYLSDDRDCNCFPSRCPRFTTFKNTVIAQQQQKTL